jgi:hypothetical protein
MDPSYCDGIGTRSTTEASFAVLELDDEPTEECLPLMSLMPTLKIE